MSIKTLRKRIALVAVSALGVGLLSVAPASAAAIDVNETNITSTAATAVCFVSTDQETAYVPKDSLGVVIGFVAGAATDTAVLEISGPAKFTTFATGTNGGVAATNELTTLTRATLGDIGDGGNSTVTLVPTGALGTVTVTISATAGGVSIDTLTIVVQSACTTNTWSATTSFVQTSATATGNADSNVDVNTSATAGSPLYVKLVPKNEYGESITSGGTLTANATNGAVVNFGAIGSIVAGIASQDTDTSAANIQLRVDPSQSATTSTTTVTISLNGVNIATKNLTFFGQQASIEVVKVASGNSGTADTGYVFYRYKDSAGNVVPGTAASFVAATAGTQITTGTSIKAPTSAAASILGNGSIANNVEYAAGEATANGMMMYTCGAASGTAKFTIATANTVTAATLTAEVTGKCYGGISSYTVSTDKASYKIGEIATITITAKDSSGNPVADNSQLAASSISVGGGSLTYTILGTAAAAASEIFTDGKVSIKAQMTTAGSFNTVVQLAGLSSTAGYTVTGGDVSNAEVLASIVKLIAAINKQIRALQKQLRR